MVEVIRTVAAIALAFLSIVVACALKEAWVQGPQAIRRRREAAKRGITAIERGYWK